MAIGTPTSIGTATPAVVGTSHTISAGAIPAGPNTLGILVMTYGSSGVTLPTASTFTGGGLTWTKAVDITFLAIIGWGFSVWTADASAGMSASTLTLTTSTSCDGANLSGSYCTGLDVTATRVNITDGQGVDTPGTANWDTTATTTTYPDVLVIGGALNDGSTTNTATGGATELHDFQNATRAWNHTTEYKILSATASTSLTGTFSSVSGRYISGFATFKMASGGSVYPSYGPRRTNRINGPFSFFEARTNPAVSAPPATITVKRLPATGVG